MLGAGGTCDFRALSECRCPASTSVTGFCACLRPAAPRFEIRRVRVCSEGLPVPREPALLTSGGRMPKRSQHRASAGQDARSERPATGHGQPRAVRPPRAPQVEILRPLSGMQVKNLRPRGSSGNRTTLSAVRRSPSRRESPRVRPGSSSIRETSCRRSRGRGSPRRAPAGRRGTGSSPSDDRRRSSPRRRGAAPA